ncbi:RNase H family protein [Glutamicibacter protophormiae]|uniref:RNase H family protein n=1 Tax=Glutamicibacter protophormiae TaxID=37930 RepID=UPI002A83B4E7|nr:RNase H family protein [Glutamicibacter protophormiae]WPR63947.1 RNase H family protein [Glutamicibacter protophormiae]WPR67442.1 RNase H family protein [Glutamicibacter protophormiae]
MTITAAADGSALGNPGPAGWAWYIDEENWASGGWDHGTNNMGELQAVLELFRATAQHPEQELKILCDSQYAINCISKWMPGWKKRGWKKADGKPVLNQEILKELDAAINGRKYTFEWVKGHAGHDLNEAADDRARAAATAHQQGSAPDPGPGYTAGAAPAAESEPEPAGAVAEAPDSAASQDTAATIYELELGFLDPQIRTSFTELSDFLHPGYQEVTRAGGLLDVATVRAQLEAGAPLPATGEVQVLTAREVDRDLALLAYRMKVEDSPILVVSSWWQRTEGGWKLRFRQETVQQ